jgi:hypothetical protein
MAGYGELLREEAERLKLGQLAPDIERILTAAKHLLARISHRDRCIGALNRS